MRLYTTTAADSVANTSGYRPCLGAASTLRAHHPCRGHDVGIRTALKLPAAKDGGGSQTRGKQLSANLKDKVVDVQNR